MRDLDRRLMRLEAMPGDHSRVKPSAGGGLAEKVREIDETIRRLDTQIEGEEACMSPEEVAESRREHAEHMSDLASLSLEEKITLLDLEIEGLGGGGLS